MSAGHGFDRLVVLMLENRPFDNHCGYLYEEDEPKAHEGPLSHLGHPCVELSHADEAIEHLLRHAKSR